ncbi:MAG: glycosyltransferase family 1 protein [Hyphomonadaceae bacterium]|nr:glycosyltransferase family 1 protein [Hyphomonadaceae bacterium]
MTQQDRPLIPAAPDQDPTRLMLVTDAWEPQVNGVVRTLSRVIKELREMGVEVEVVSPSDGYKTMPLITYEEIKLAIGARDDVEERFKAFAPDAVHIATEGTLGWDARHICLDYKFPFTTSYHTQFPEYVHARFWWIPTWAGYAYMRAFHNKSGRVMVATPSMMERLESRGMKNITAWSRGVDTELFHPSKRGIDGGVYKDLPKPVWAYVGRVAVEKNIEAFLKLDLPGTKVVVGGGPLLEELQTKYPDAKFTGPKFGDELAQHYADADVFVFPSFTDTFGLVILEAMAAGTPVAGFMAPGPKDIIPGSGAGAVNDDLKIACMEALKCDRETTRKYAEKFSWRACAEDFLRNLQPLPKPEKVRFWRRLRALRKKKPKPVAPGGIFPGGSAPPPQAP